MSEPTDTELEALLAELAPTQAERTTLLEEHRQLEKDLLRLADPLPPPDFLANVMSRVAVAPARPLSRADVWSAVAIEVLVRPQEGLLGHLGGLGLRAQEAQAQAVHLALHRLHQGRERVRVTAARAADIVDPRVRRFSGHDAQRHRGQRREDVHRMHVPPYGGPGPSLLPP